MHFVALDVTVQHSFLTVSSHSYEVTWLFLCAIYCLRS